jgi:hypothetical protein
MPKVTGPLFSIAASGSVAGLLTFKQTTHGAVCTVKPANDRTRTTRQATERDRMKAAAVAWHGLDNDTRTIWQSNSLPTIKSAWMCFFHEYVAQQIIAPNLPRIPGTFLGLLAPAEPDEPIIINDLGTLLVHRSRRYRGIGIVVSHDYPHYKTHSMRDSFMHGIIFNNNRGILVTHGAAQRQQPFDLPAAGGAHFITHGMRTWPKHGTARNLNRGILNTHGAARRQHKI